MAKKERQDKKEKPLEKMTSNELKAIAMEIPDITGVHGMNKSELISVIKEHRGIKEEKSAKAIDTRAIKRRIAELKEQKERLREAGDKDKADFLRRKISRLKKKTRRAA